MMEQVSRRGLIAGIAGLAALAVVPRTARSLPQSDMERLHAMADRGLIVGQTFWLDAPIKFSGMTDLHIHNCTFIISGDMHGEPAGIHFADGCGNVKLTDIRMDLRGAYNWQHRPTGLVA